MELTTENGILAVEVFLAVRLKGQEAEVRNVLMVSWGNNQPDQPILLLST